MGGLLITTYVLILSSINNTGCKRLVEDMKVFYKQGQILSSETAPILIFNECCMCPEMLQNAHWIQEII